MELLCGTTSPHPIEAATSREARIESFTTYSRVPDMITISPFDALRMYTTTGLPRPKEGNGLASFIVIALAPWDKSAGAAATAPAAAAPIAAAFRKPRRVSFLPTFADVPSVSSGIESTLLPEDSDCRPDCTNSILCYVT